MKRFIVLSIFMIGLVTVGYAQTDQVSFIHGLGDTPAIWDDMAGELGEEFDFIRDDVYYNSGDAVSSAASNAYIPEGTVSVVHSLGGLLAREYLRQHGTDRMKALITVGTPHRGALAAKTVQNGQIAKMINDWVEDLAAGPVMSLGGIFGKKYAIAALAGLSILSAEGEQILNTRLHNYFGYTPSVDDLKPSSSFLSTLNASPEHTLPPARYAIFGLEDDYQYVRLFESFQRKGDGYNPLEQGSGVDIHHDLTAIYLYVASVYSSISAAYYYEYLRSDFSDPFYFDYYYYRHIYYGFIAVQWWRGYGSLIYYQQRDWDQDVIGVNHYYEDGQLYKDANDGLLPYTTQAPSFFDKPDDIERILPADGANHVEETVHPSVRDRLEEVFQNRDVNIPKIHIDEPLRVSIHGVPYVTVC